MRVGRGVSDSMQPLLRLLAEAIASMVILKCHSNQVSSYAVLRDELLAPGGR